MTDAQKAIVMLGLALVCCWGPQTVGSSLRNVNTPTYPTGLTRSIPQAE